MDRNKFLIFLVVGIIIIIGVLAIFLIRPTKSIQPYYSDDPKTWIEDTKEGIKIINVDKVTKGTGYVNFNGLQYDNGVIKTVFSSEGWYKGQYFKTQIQDENNKVLMRISEKMNISDGVIEGFIIEKIEDNKPKLYVFVDNDWKNKISNTKIYWGKRYEHEKIFDFSNRISNGIYLNVVEDDNERFSQDYTLHEGGIWVGDIKEDNSGTLISLN